MAKAGHDDSTIYVPPGFRQLTEVVAAEGLDTVRDRLASGEPAFGLSLHSGEMIKIPLGLWRTHEALEVLEHGIWYRPRRSRGPYSFQSGPGIEDFVVLVADKPAVDTMPGDDAPPKQIELRKTSGTAQWIMAEVKRMKQDGEIPDDIHITDLAKDLANRMSTAATKDPSLRPVGWRHIKNNLSRWGLWPVSGIK